MHPGDVAEFVADQVTVLRDAVAGRSDLRVESIELVDDVQLYVAFDKHERAAITAVVPAAVVAPGAMPVGLSFTGIDLRRASTTRRVVAHFDCSDFDGEPPTLELQTEERELLGFDQWPKDLAGGGIVADHPDYPRPFICRRGLREFHTHPEHEDEPWDRYRESLTLPRIVIELLEDLQRRWILSTST